MLKAAVETYPEVDFLVIGMPEKRKWVGKHVEAWNALDAKYGLSDVTSLERLLEEAGRRTDYPGGASRAVLEVKGDLTALHFYDRLANLAELGRGRDSRSGNRKPIMWVYNSVAEELFPILERILPAGSETLNFIDYTPTRILRRRKTLAALGGGKLPAILIYTLHDDNVGVLPQLATRSLHTLTRELRRHAWAGFSTRYWLISDHDPCVAYLARASWDESTTPESVYRDQIRSVCGDKAVGDMLEVFRELEAATVTLEDHGLGLTFPVPGMIMKHWTAQAMPEKLLDVQRNYQRAQEAARRAGAKSTERGRSYVDYWIGRLEFGAGYLDTAKTVRAAASATKLTEALRHSEAALAKSRHALGSLRSSRA